MTMDKQRERLGSSQKSPPRDNLALDAADALAAGMSYGKYKALHPRTAETNEARLAQKPKRQEHPPQQKTRIRPAYVKTCPTCLKEFTTTTKLRRYCSEACKKKKENAAWARSTTK